MVLCVPLVQTIQYLRTDNSLRPEVVVHKLPAIGMTTWVEERKCNALHLKHSPCGERGKSFLLRNALLADVDRGVTDPANPRNFSSSPLHDQSSTTELTCQFIHAAPSCPSSLQSSAASYP